MTITHKSIQATLSLIINAENNWVVCVIVLEKLILPHILEIKLTFLEGYLLTLPCYDSHFLDIIFLIRCVHHSGHIVHVFLLSDASIYS